MPSWNLKPSFSKIGSYKFQNLLLQGSENWQWKDVFVSEHGDAYVFHWINFLFTSWFY